MATYDIGNITVEKLIEPAGGPNAVFGDTINAPGIDSLAASTLFIGITNATGMTIGHTGITVNHNAAISSFTNTVNLNTVTSTGTLTIDTGGSFALNIGGTNAVSVGLGHSGMITTSFGPLTVNQDALFLGTNFTIDSSVMNLGDASTDIINTIAAINTSVPFGQIGSTGNFSIYALQQSSALSVGTQMTYTSGRGGNAVSGSNAGNGGASSFISGQGGDGYTGQTAGAGGTLTIKSGDAGATNGGSGNNSGAIVIDSGVKSGAGTNGAITLGTTNASAVTMGRTAGTTTVAGNTITFNTNTAPNLIFSQISTNLEIQSDGYRVINTDGYGNTAFGTSSGNTNVNGVSVIQTASSLFQIYTAGLLGFSTNGGQTVIGENGNSETFIRSGSSIVVQPLNGTTFSRFSVSGSTVRYKGEDATMPGTSISFLAGSGLIGHTGVDGYAGGAAIFQSGNGGDGYTGQTAGAGGALTVQAGNAGATNGGTGNNGGSIVMDAGIASGVGTNGAVSIGTSNASAVGIGRIGMITTNYGYLTVNGPTALNHNVYLGDAPDKLIFFNGLSVTDLQFVQGSIGIKQIDTSQPTNGVQFNISSGNGADGYASGNGTNASAISINAGQGGAAFTTHAAGNGGFAELNAGNGGAGTASGAAGVGGTVLITAGTAGADNGGGGAGGGGITLQAGDATGTGGTGGGIIIDSGSGTTPGGVSIGASVAGGIILGNDSTFITVYAPIVAFGASQDHAIYVNQTGIDTEGKKLYLRGGYGGVASATGGGTGGELNASGGWGGDGTATKAGGYGGPLTLVGGNAGANNGGGGGNSGGVLIDSGIATGAGLYGEISIGETYASNISIGGASSPGAIYIDSYGSNITIGSANADLNGSSITFNTHVLLQGRASLEVDQTTYLYGNTYIGLNSAHLIALTGTINGSANFNATAGSTGVFKGDIASTGMNGDFQFYGGKGGNATGALVGGHGSRTSLTAGPGGDASATFAAGDGGAARIISGDAGSNTAGGGGANSGDIILDVGAKSGAGTNGAIYIGAGANAPSSITIAQVGTTTLIDGYVEIDNQVTLSHDIGFGDTIALTQDGNTTTGADLRLRHLRFFSDNVPTNQAPQMIYATGGDLVISSPSQNIMVDAPQMYWAQDANIYSGGFKLKVGPFNNYIQMADSTSNTVPAYDFVSTLTGGSVGTNYSIRDVLTTTYTANGVDTVAHYLNVVNNTNDAYSGSTTGLSVDVSGGTNTSFPKTAAKFTGGKIWADGYLQQTSGAVSLTANAASQISTTSGNLTVDSAATLKLGAIAATQTNVGRDGYVLTVDAYGHIVTTIAMSPAIAPGAGAGTGGSATITGHDVDGYLTINTGTSTPGASLVATITFANAYGAPPRNILLSPGNQAASDQTASSSAYTPVIGATGGPTITTWTIYSGTIGLSNNTTYIWNYLVIG